MWLKGNWLLEKSFVFQNFKIQSNNHTGFCYAFFYERDKTVCFATLFSTNKTFSSLLYTVPFISPTSND